MMLAKDANIAVMPMIVAEKAMFEKYAFMILVLIILVKILVLCVQSVFSLDKPNYALGVPVY